VARSDNVESVCDIGSLDHDARGARRTSPGSAESMSRVHAVLGPTVVLAPVLVVDALAERHDDDFAVWRLPAWARAGLYAGLWFLATLMGDFRAGQFLYFQF
jgi:hypothetical protein